MNTQELMLKIRGDNTDLENKLSQSGASIKSLGTSTEKISSAMKGFGRDLLQVRDASDLASIAAKALGTAVGASIGGAVVISAGKVLIDAFNSVQNAAKESEKAISSVRDQVGNLGGGVGFEQARAGAASLYAEAEKVSEKIKEIESNPLTSFIAGITGAREQMSLLVSETREQAKALAERGVVNSLIDKEQLAGLDEVGKKVRAVGEEYKPLIDAARETGNADLLRYTILKSQEAQQKVVADEQKKQADEQQKINDRRKKEDADRETENELNEMRRARNLERTRKELEEQTRQAEKALKLEKQKEEEAQFSSQFKAAGGVYSGKGGRSSTDLFQRAAKNSGIERLLLGSTMAGEQSLDVARRQRGRQVSREDFQYQNKILGEEAKRLSEQEGRTVTMQDVRNRMAKQIAAGEMPSLQERITGQMQGVEPSQLAASRAQEATQAKGAGVPDLISAIEKLVSEMRGAPLVTSGAGG